MGGPGAFWITVIVLCVIGAVAGAFLISGMSAISDHNATDGNRRDALAAAQHYVLTFDSIDPRNADKAKATIEPLLTTKAKTAFDQQTDQWAQLAQALAQEVASSAPSAGASSSASPSAAPSGIVRYGAISAISVDTATALVADDAGIPSANKVIPYRWEISLRKISGKWLVDDVQRIQ